MESLEWVRIGVSFVVLLLTASFDDVAVIQECYLFLLATVGNDFPFLAYCLMSL